jgi:phosphate starvation-inducible PhoH-like protein
MKKRHHRRQLKAKTDNQFEYIRAIAESDITICTGPAGSGKTTVSVGLACEYLTSSKVEKIIITRPVVESGKGLGFLPGSFHDKIYPYLVPVVEEMNGYLGTESVKKLIAENIIEICPLEYMRGRNFHNAFIILDEAQNATFEQIKMFLTRMGRKSKCVINGDIDQSDLIPRLKGALTICADRLDGVAGVSVVRLTEDDIIRNKIIARILAKLDPKDG